ncbi:hypothetical protein CAEBREN_14162 [Caenorhabditis brenneri]|uniref:Uncharacterized protein n=1 Tax=Caenorhabditis brenneri TaxID=135651 RepID=G0NP84_CAEBE|nr:hypothetical protein CAEBREN_14162 [Caenorhabditis brenneri]
MSKPLSYKIQRDNKEEGSTSANGTEQPPSKKQVGAGMPENFAATSKEKSNYFRIKPAKCLTVDRPNALPISTSDDTLASTFGEALYNCFIFLFTLFRNIIRSGEK